MKRAKGAKRHGVALAALALFATEAFATTAAPVQPSDADWVEAWRSDLAFLETRLAKVHPDPFGRVSRPELAAELETLKGRLPELAHHQIVVELARVIARIGDGHTRVTLPLPEGAHFFLGHSKTPAPEIPGLVFGHLPVRFSLFSDGLHVIRSTPDQAELAGTKVVRLGRMSAEEAIAAVTPIVHHDNDSQLRFQLPDFLAIPEVLHAAGVTAGLGRVRLEVETADGQRRVVELEPRAADGPLDWAEAYDTARTPLHLGRRDEPFWFEILENGRTVFFQFNEVADGSDETLAEFCNRLFTEVERDKAENSSDPALFSSSPAAGHSPPR